MRDSSTLSYETESSVSVAKSRHHDSGVLKNPSEGQDRRYKGRQTPEPSILMRSNTLLRREINLLNVHRDEQIADLEGTITHLQEVNKNLNAMMSRFRDMERVRANQSGGPLAEVKSLVAKLKEKDEELENKIDQITSLEEQLSARNRLENIYDDMKSNLGCTSSFSKGLAELEEGAHQLAGFLVQCLSNKRIQNLRKKPQRQRELSEFITSILGRIGLLITDPNACMRALIFSFMRERIFMSNCWTTLHFEGYMLRELQDIIQKMCTFLQKFIM